MRSKKIKPCEVGDIIIKNNNKPFGHEIKFITLKVESILFNGHRWIINNLYLVSNGSITKISEEQKAVIDAEWNSIGISEYNGSDNDPCIRTDNGLPKLPVVESSAKELVYNYRHKYNNPAFEVYRCPTCNLLHLGKISHILETI